VVDYGAKQQVCTMKMPASIARGETDRFLEELIPDSMRGRLENTRTAISSEANQVFQLDYEHVTIAIHISYQRADDVSVFFRREDCKGR